MSDDPKAYVAGFLFRKLGILTQVLLVRKSRPEWQDGMMNGIGGKIEPHESPEQAMRREFFQEANYITNAWDQFAFEQGPGYCVYFYRHTMPSDWETSNPYEAPAKNDVGEELEWCTVGAIKYPVIGNLHWLIPLALDPRPIDSIVKTTGDIRRIVTW